MHRLTDINIETRTAICEECGPVRVKPGGRENKSWRCCVSQRKWKKPGRSKASRIPGYQKPTLGTCPICLTDDVVLIWDHCHVTLIGRGMICKNATQDLECFLIIRKH